jgi:hypothetical protein
MTYSTPCCGPTDFLLHPMLVCESPRPLSPAKFAIGRNKTHVPNLKYRMHSNGAPGTDPQCVSRIRQAATFALDRLQALRLANAMSPEQVKCISDQIVQRYNCDLVQNERAFVIRTHNSDQRFDLVTDFFHHHH